MGFVFIIHPFILFVPTSILSGYYANRDDIEMANLHFKIHYISLSIAAFAYLILLVYFYYRLIRVINYQIENRENREHEQDEQDVRSDNNSDINTWKRAKRNVSIIQGKKNKLMKQFFVKDDNDKHFFIFLFLIR